MKRRNFISKTIAGVSLYSLAGCIENEDNIRKTPTPNSSNLDTKTPDGSTEDSNDSETDNITNQIEANYNSIKSFVPNYFKRYSLTEAEIHINTTNIDSSRLTEEMEILLIVQEYPNEGIIDTVRTDTISLPDDGPVEVTYPQPSLPDNSPFYLTATLIPSGTSLTELNSERTVHIADSDRLTIEDNKLTKGPHPDLKESLETDSYTRKVGEGIYGIELTGDKPFRVVIFKSSYIEYKNKTTQNAVDVITNSIENGIATELSRVINSEANIQNYTSKKDKIEYTQSAVQSLPSVSNDTSFNENNKYPIETIVDGGGDSKDITILLSAILSSQTFQYKTALIWLPGDNPNHIGLGVNDIENVDGTYFNYRNSKYYYMEPIGTMWDIGEIPDDYEDSVAQVEPII